MEIPAYVEDLPVTPTGRQFLAPNLYTVMNVAIGLKHDIDLDAIKSHFSNSIMLKIPRFSSLLVKHGKYYFRPTRVDLDKHIIVHHQNRGCGHDHQVSDGDGADDNRTDEDIVNDYLADLAVSEPLSTDKPLWELHILMDVKCLVFRVHHAVCDGSTLMSVIKEIGSSAADDSRSSVEKVSDNASGDCANGKPMKEVDGGGDCGKGKPMKEVDGGREIRNKSGRKKKGRRGFLGYLAYLWYSIVYCTQLLARFFIAKDRKTAVNDGGGFVQLRPQGMATARFSMDDFNIVRKGISHATINDILTGVLWGGLVRYLDDRSKTAVQEGQQITGIVMVNMRKQKGLQDISKALSPDDKSSKTLLGNSTSIMLLPLHYTRKLVDPLDYVKKAKSIMDKKKQSCEARFLVRVQRSLHSVFGLKLVNNLTTVGGCNSTFGISNVVGPAKEIVIGGNPVTYIKLTVCSSPIRLMMHMVSYMKNLDLQLLVAKDVISDPKFLAECFTETLKSMKNAVEQTIVKEVSIQLEDSASTPGSNYK